MTDHVPRVDQLEIIARKNELERVVPIYRAALEWIANSGGAGTAAAHVADQALREADREDSRR